MSADDGYRDEPPTDRWPPNFSSWPLDVQIRTVTMRMKRRGLIDAVLAHSGIAHDERTERDDRKLTKEELAAIYLTLEGFNDGGD